MRHRIDPKVDCVFKALLGAEGNRSLLIHFLNAVLGADLPQPITTVEIRNPYNDQEFLSDNSASSTSRPAMRAAVCIRSSCNCSPTAI